MSGLLYVWIERVRLARDQTQPNLHVSFTLSKFLSGFELWASFVKSEHKFAIAIENSSAQRLARHINFICCQLYLLFSHVFSCLHSFLFDLFAVLFFLLSLICSFNVPLLSTHFFLSLLFLRFLLHQCTLCTRCATERESRIKMEMYVKRCTNDTSLFFKMS